MTRFDKKSISLKKLISKSELSKYKGGDAPTNYCCGAYYSGTYPALQPYTSFCTDSLTLIESWKAFWQAAGYQVVCNFWYA